MKNERYALRDLTPTDGTRPSTLSTSCLIIDGRDDITLGRVTLSEGGRGGSKEHYVVTDLRGSLMVW